MPLAVPPELKKIVPFIRRAEELDRDTSRPESRLVAYYLRQYAVQIGIPLSTNNPVNKVCLGHILEALEAEHGAMSVFTREEAAMLCRQFANQVFEVADGQDRMGLANQNTAKTFYAASTFLQLLEQFDDGDSQVEEGGEENEERASDKKKILYCKWKATDILKAIKEGRQPTVGGYGEDLLAEDGDNNDDDDDDDDPSEKKQDAPLQEHEEQEVGVERVLTQDEKEEPQDDDSVEDEPAASNNDKDEEMEEEEEGTEVDIHLAPPPPAYPGPPPPAMDFNLPPPPVKPPTPMNVVADSPPPASASKTSFFGLVGGKKGSNKSVNKAQFDDALELTNFALAALHDKDADLAAQRLKQALSVLGR